MRKATASLLLALVACAPDGRLVPVVDYNFDAGTPDASASCVQPELEDELLCTPVALCGPVDVAVILDSSTSMKPYIEQVKDAANCWPNQYAQTDVRFALIAAPSDSVAGVDRLVRFTDNLHTVVTHLEGQHALGSDSEPTLDALWFARDGLEWRDVPRAIVVIADEDPQSRLGLTAAEVASHLSAAGIQVHVLTDPFFFPEWAVVAGRTGGILRDLTLPAEMLESSISEAVRRSACP